MVRSMRDNDGRRSVHYGLESLVERVRLGQPDGGVPPG